MKKLIVTAVAALIAAAASAQTVGSANVMGYSKVELKPNGTYHLVACNFESGSSNFLNDVFGTNQLRQSDFLSACDKITIWNTESQTYQRWAQWTDGVFYKANDASEWNQGISGNPAVPAGSSFWIISAGSSDTNTIMFSGDVILSPTNEISINQSYQMIAYPFSSEVLLNETTFLEDGASASDFLSQCDRTSFWDEDTETYQRYAIWTDGQWYKANDAEEWNQGILATSSVNLANGFWYQARTNFIWSETNRYLKNIQ